MFFGNFILKTFDRLLFKFIGTLNGILINVYTLFSPFNLCIYRCQYTLNLILIWMNSIDTKVLISTYYFGYITINDYAY